MGDQAEVSPPDDVTTISPYRQEAIQLAKAMVDLQNVGDAAKMLGMTYSYAFRMTQSEEYMQARNALLQGLDPEKVAIEGRLFVRLWEEANDFIEGTATSRIAALRTLTEIKGMNKAQEHKLTVDTAPGIKLNLVPANKEDEVDEADPVIEADVEDVDE